MYCIQVVFSSKYGDGPKEHGGQDFSLLYDPRPLQPEMKLIPFNQRVNQVVKASFVNPDTDKFIAVCGEHERGLLYYDQPQ